MFSLADAWLAAVGFRPSLRILLTLAIALGVLTVGMSARAADPPLRIPILVYHRFGPSLADDMTVTTPVFEGQLRTLQERGHKIIPLRDLLAALADSQAALPPGAVVLTLDDGHRTV